MSIDAVTPPVLRSDDVVGVTAALDEAKRIIAWTRGLNVHLDDPADAHTCDTELLPRPHVNRIYEELGIHSRQELISLLAEEDRR